MKIKIVGVSARSQTGSIPTDKIIKEVATALGKLSPVFKGKSFRQSDTAVYRMKTSKRGPVVYLEVPSNGSKLELSAFNDYISTESMAIVTAKDVKSLIAKFAQDYNKFLDRELAEPRKRVEDIEKLLLKAV